MKILFIHPYGTSLGDWNHRLKRQTELMSKKCDLKILGSHVSFENGIDNIFQKQIQDTIKDFNPDVLYVSGFAVAHYCLDIFDKVVYDMGAFIGRRILMEQAKLDYNEIEKKPSKELQKIAGFGYSNTYYEMEKKVIEKVKAIVIWEGREARLVQKLYEPGDRLKEISMIIHETPESIPFEQKEDRAMAIAAKWGDREKMSGLLRQVKERYPIKVIGHGYNVSFIEHKGLMDELNRSKVLFCPFKCGGIGVVCEALKMGCNVVAYDWYPFDDYLNRELVVNGSNKPIGRAVEAIKRAMGQYYPLRKELPLGDKQVDKIINVCQQINN